MTDESAPFQSIRQSARRALHGAPWPPHVRARLDQLRADVRAELARVGVDVEAPEIETEIAVAVWRLATALRETDPRVAAAVWGVAERVFDDALLDELRGALPEDVGTFALLVLAGFISDLDPA